LKSRLNLGNDSPRLSVRLPQELHLKLMAQAKQQGVSPSVLVRDSLVQTLAINNEQNKRIKGD
jgi:predicted HicB family RNase H-like nuclease